MDMFLTPKRVNKKKPHPARDREAGRRTDLIPRRLAEHDGRRKVVANG
jgi:hypothetical protein